MRKVFAFIASPMKTLLDRVSIMYLQKRLVGRPGVVVATAGMSPREPILDSIAMPMVEMGLKVVARLDATASMGPIDNPGEVRKRAEETAKEILPFVTGEKLIESDEESEKRFQGMKAEMPLMKEGCPAVYNYWKDNGFLEVETYAELLEKVRKKAVVS